MSEIKKIKFKELPQKSETNNSDVFAISDGICTYKIHANDIAKYMRSNDNLNSYFVHQDSIGIADGVTPLNENTKIEGSYITYGILPGTSYEGSAGKILEQNIDSHLVDVNPHGLGNVNNTSDINKPVSIAQRTAIDEAYANSNSYTDHKISEIINGAPETLDTLKEIADAISENKTVVEVLNTAIGLKANQTELDTHTGNEIIHVTPAERALWNTVNDKVTKVSGKDLSSNDYTMDEKLKLDGIAEQANKYIHPTTDGNKHVPANGNSNGGKYLKSTSVAGNYEWGELTSNDITAALGYAPGTGNGDVITYELSKSGSTINLTGSDGTTTYVTDSNTVYGVVSTSANGLAPMRTGTTTKFLRDDGIWAIPPDTNTNDSVTQIVCSEENINYRLLMGYTADDVNRTECTRKVPYMTYNPSTKTLTVPNIAGIASKALNDSNGNPIINEMVSATEPTSQKVGDYWLQEY